MKLTHEQMLLAPSWDVVVSPTDRAAFLLRLMWRRRPRILNMIRCALGRHRMYYRPEGGGYCRRVHRFTGVTSPTGRWAGYCAHTEPTS